MEHDEADRSDWRKHVEADLGRLRQAHHDLRDQLNAINLANVKAMAELKEELADVKLSNVQEMSTLKNELIGKLADLKSDVTTKLATLQLTLEKKETGASIWATIGSSIFAAIPAICVLIWWLVSSRNK